MDKLKDKLAAAFIQLEKSDLVKSEILYRECMEESQGKNPEWFKSALLGLGNVKSMQGNFEEAQLLYRELKETASLDSDWPCSAIALHQLGVAERLAGNLKAAKEHFYREYDILQKHMPADNALFAANYYENGLVSLNEGKLKAAKKMMQTSLDYALKSGEPVSIGYSYRGQGAVLQAIGRNEEALTSFASAKKAFGQAGDSPAFRNLDQMMAGLANHSLSDDSGRHLKAD